MGLIRKKILTNMIMYQHTYTVTLYKLTCLKWSPCMGDLGFHLGGGGGGGGAKGGKGGHRQVVALHSISTIWNSTYN